jgi:hypothetical protein
MPAIAGCDSERRPGEPTTLSCDDPASATRAGRIKQTREQGIEIDDGMDDAY